MAKKIRLTRLELKRQRDSLEQFECFLPTLKLKQQQLQMALRDIDARRKELDGSAAAARAFLEPYRAVLADLAGLDVRALSRPTQVRTGTSNVAGVAVPVFEDVAFATAVYSLFATPPWVDRALADLRQLHRLQAELDVLQQQHDVLSRELTRVVQRVNLFEKVKIPEARDIIRRIRIYLGDQMTAAVGRAKIAKAKLAEDEGSPYEAAASARQPETGGV